MKIKTIGGAVLAAMLLGGSVLAGHDDGRKGVQVHNLADDFSALYDATDGQTVEERRAAFKAQIQPLFPRFYRVRGEGDKAQAGFDAMVDRAIADFPKIRDGYDKKVQAFGNQIETNIQTFSAYFPDFAPDFDVYFIHSLGQMDGGTRTLDGVYTFIFGADVMTRFHQFDSETAFFHHELFHVYHNGFAEEASCTQLWCNVWAEGLATYASEVLNPEATPAEKLLEIPLGLIPGTEARLKFALEDLKGALASEEEADYGRFLSFSKDDTGLPRRRGYYLGLLIARVVGKDFSLTDMAHMTHAEAKPHFMAALDRLIERAE